METISLIYVSAWMLGFLGGLEMFGGCLGDVSGGVDMDFLA